MFFFRDKLKNKISNLELGKKKLEAEFYDKAGRFIVIGHKFEKKETCHEFARKLLTKILVAQ